MAFGVVGALLVGLGIILIFAHNWDNLSKPIKTAISFIPLLLAQIFAGWALFLNDNSERAPLYRQISAVLIFFTLGACIAMISQVYQIEGDERHFIASWMALSLLIIYTLSSEAVSLFYILGISSLVNMNYQSGAPNIPIDFILLFVGIIPFYVYLCRQKPNSNFTVAHHWIIALTSIKVIAQLYGDLDHFTIWSFLSLFAIYYGIGKLPYFENKKLRSNPYILLGSLGTVGSIYALSFINFWKEDIFDKILQFEYSWHFWSLPIIALAFLLFNNSNSAKRKDLNPIEWSFLLLLPIIILGRDWPSFAVILVNVLLLLFGIYYLYKGQQKNKVALLNYGLFIITFTIMTRFFELDFSFVSRGIAFVIFGIGFFIANYFLIKKSK